MKIQGKTLLQRDGTKTVLASLLSIVIGLAVGSLLVLIVGLFSDNLGLSSAWEGIRLIFFGILSTGRNAVGTGLHPPEHRQHALPGHAADPHRPVRLGGV